MYNYGILVYKFRGEPMEKVLDVKYNTQNIKIFLSLFNLSLEEKETDSKELKIFMEDLEVGKVYFGEEEIAINTTSMFGDLECKTNYAKAFKRTDTESLKTIKQIGLYASWYNTFAFELKLFNGNVFSGDCQFNVKIDNEFGNKVSPHFKFECQNGDKKYILKIMENGYPFLFLEKNGLFKEEIVYELSDNSMGSFMYHERSDKFTDGKNVYDYKELMLISSIIENKTDIKNTAVIHKEFNDNWIIHNYNEFDKLASSGDLKEFIHKANYMHLIDPTLLPKINKLIGEFSVEGESFLEKVILYGFTNYSKEEIYALFGLDKKDIDLEKMYFGKEDIKSLERKLFLP